MWLPKSLHIRKFRSAWPYLSKGPTHPSEIVEYTKRGKSVRESNIDAGQGGAFGIAILTALPMPAAAAIRNVKPHQMRWRVVQEEKMAEPKAFGGRGAFPDTDERAITAYRRQGLSACLKIGAAATPEKAQGDTRNPPPYRRRTLR